MALISETMNISFAQGLDTKTDPKQVMPGKLTSLQNGIFTETGAIKKRFGYTALSQNILGGGTISKGVSLKTFQDELLLGDGENLYSYSKSANAWEEKSSSAPSISLTTRSIQANTHNLSFGDVAYHSSSNLFCYIFTDSTSSELRYSVVDKGTGVILVNNALVVSSASFGRVVTLGNNFVICYVISGTLSYKTIATSTPTTLSSATTIATNVQSTNAFECQVTGSSAYIAWALSDNTSLSFATLSSSFVLSSAYTVSIGSTVKNLTLGFDSSQNVWCALSVVNSPNTDLKALVVNSALTTTVLALTLVESKALAQEIALTLSGTTANIYYSQIGAMLKSATLTLAGSVGTPKVIVYNAALASKVITHNSQDYLVVNYSGSYKQNGINQSVLTTVEPCYFLLDTSGTVLGKFAQLNSGLHTINPIVPSIVASGTGTFDLVYLSQNTVTASAGTVKTFAGLSAVSFNFAPSFVSPVEMGEALNLTGAQVTSYDGGTLTEQNFHLSPENLVISGQGSGSGLGALSGGGTYSYIAVYEWIDQNGQIQRSHPSAPLSVPMSANTPSTTTGTWSSGDVTISVADTSIFFLGQVVSATGIPTDTHVVKIDSTNKQITLDQATTAAGSSTTITTTQTGWVSIGVPALYFTNKANVIISLYRTVLNGSVYYRISDYSSLTYNDKTLVYYQTIGINDGTSDYELVGNQELYTTGGEVPNSAPPPFDFMIPYRSRVIGVSSEDKLSWWYSKQVIEGSPVEFSDLFVNYVDAAIGSITAVGAMDDKLIFFGPTSKYFVTGSGPAPDGSNNDFSEALPIVGTTGSTNQASLVLIPNGLMYQTPNKGIWLLDRSLQEHYIGSDVEAYNSDTVTSATLIENTTQVRFTLSSGVTLVYDYLFNQWSVFTNISAVDACNFNGAFSYLSGSGLVCQESSSLFTDNGSFIELSLTTAWIQLAGLQGYQRIWRAYVLGDYKSPHTLNVKVFADYITSNPQSVAIPVTSQPTSAYQFKIHLINQRSQAVQFQISDSQISPFGEGFSISNLAFEYGVKPFNSQLGKIPASQSFG